MGPRDDPEARIRELERPLTDHARTSELGAAQTGYFYPPAQPPLTYGALPPTQRATAGCGGRWIVLAVFVIGGMTIGASIAFGVHTFSIPVSISAGRSSIPNTPSSVTPRPGGELTVAGVGADTINASGLSNQVTFHSGSPTVEKSGESNVVQQRLTGSELFGLNGIRRAVRVLGRNGIG